MILKPYVSSIYPTAIACQLPIFEFRLTIMMITPITVIVDAASYHNKERRLHRVENTVWEQK